MNTRQILQAGKNTLLTLRWSPTGDYVLPKRSVLISPLPTADGFKDVAMPALLLRPASSSGDPEHGAQPDYFQQQIELAVITAQRGSRFGTNPLMGAKRAQAGESKGRGELEIESLAIEAINEMPYPIQSAVANSAIPDSDSGRGYMVTRVHTFNAWVSALPTHGWPELYTASVAGSIVTLAWEPPEDPTDLYEYVVRRTQGDRPALNVNEGDGITVVGQGASDSPGVGTWTYTVFAIYTDPGGSIGLHQSVGEHLTVEVT